MLTVAGLSTYPNSNNVMMNDQMWMRTLESLLPTIRSRIDNSAFSVSPALALKYQGDFYGLLLENKIAAQYHWITMRLNDMTTPTEYDGTKQIIFVPNTGYIDQQYVLYITLYRKNT